MNHSVTREKRDGLYELLREKILIFKNFLSLSRSLKEMLEKENMLRVRVLLRQRQDDMTRIDRLDARMLRLKDVDMGGPAPKLDKRLPSLLKELEETIKEAIRADEDCADLAFSRIEGLRDDLVRVSAGKQGFRDYRGKPQKPRFLDLRT